MSQKNSSSRLPQNAVNSNIISHFQDNFQDNLGKVKSFEESVWFGIIINLYCILAVFLPISGIFSNFINSSFLFLWKEILVFGIFCLIILHLWRRRQLIPKGSQTLFLAFLVFVILMIFNSVFFQKLPLQAVLLGFRFELWWLFLFILSDFLMIILKKESKNQFEESKQFEQSKQFEKEKVLPNNYDLEKYPLTPLTVGTLSKSVQVGSGLNILNNYNLENELQNELTDQNQNSNLQINSKNSRKIGRKVFRKTTAKQKLRLSVYLGFSLLVALYFVNLAIGQTSLLEFFGFENNSSQISPQICQLVDFGQNSCRLTLGFGSPNHLAGYLILVLPVFWNDLWGNFWD